MKLGHLFNDRRFQGFLQFIKSVPIFGGDILFNSFWSHHRLQVLYFPFWTSNIANTFACVRRQFPDPVPGDAAGGGAARHAHRAQRRPVRKGRRQQGLRPNGARLQGDNKIHMISPLTYIFDIWITNKSQSFNMHILAFHCMFWFYVFLKICFGTCFEFTMCARELLTFMDWYYVSPQACLMSCLVFTMCAEELLTFMRWLDVVVRVSFKSCFVFTVCALVPLTFMDWFYVSLKVSFLSGFVLNLANFSIDTKNVSILPRNLIIWHTVFSFFFISI